MSLYRHSRPLLTVRGASAEDHLGTVFAVLPSDTDGTRDHEMSLRLMVQPPSPEPVIRGVPVPVPVPEPACDPCACLAHHEVEQDGPTEPEEVEGDEPDEAPQASVIVETSADRVSWVAVSEPIGLGVLPVLTGVVVLGPYVRARTVSAGVAHAVEVKLLSDASFRLELA